MPVVVNDRLCGVAPIRLVAHPGRFGPSFESAKGRLVLQSSNGPFCGNGGGLGPAPENMINRINLINYVVHHEQYRWRKGRIVHGSAFPPGTGLAMNEEALAVSLDKDGDSMWKVSLR
jgi:hypothetical protein